ncbi:hypothetical protein ACF3NG_01635 [Aerococcaceae bacterium WGS1372]
MNKKQKIYLFIMQAIVVATLFLSVAVFFLASRQGNDGVTLQIFGEGDDGAFYWAQALNVKNGLPWIRTSIYPLIIGNILKFFDSNNVYLIRLFNSIGFFLLIIASIKLVKLQYKDEGIHFQDTYYTDSKIMLLLMLMFYLSLQMNIHISILRDIWLYYLYVQNLVIGVNILLKKRANIYYILFWIFSLWLMGQFRAYILVSYIASIVVYYLYQAVSKRRRIRALIIMLVFLLGLYYTFLMDFNMPIVNKSMREALTYRLSFLTEITGGSQMGINLIQPNYLLFLVNYVMSLIGNFIGPLPWQVNSVGTLAVFFVETIPMLFILYYIYKHLSKLTNTQIFIISHAIVWIGLTAVSNDNIGTATRLRPITWILLLIIFVVIYYKSKFVKKMTITKGEHIHENSIQA